MNVSPNLKSSKSEASRRDFLHQTAHDIRGAMHVVTGMSKVLAMSDTLPPAQKEIVSVLKKNAERSLELLESLFGFLQADVELPPKRSFVEMQAPPIPKVQGKNMWALVVEDSAPAALVAASFLEELGYKCDVAKNGPKALEKFSAGHYDLIIMDVQMPGMDGLETSRRIRAIEKEKNMQPTPILAATGNATEDDRLFCMKAGMNDSLSKPFDLAVLAEKIKNITPSRGTS